jgi:hypothetical protein
MSRHPFSLFWKGPVAFIAAVTLSFIAFIATHSYYWALGTLLLGVVAYGIYVTGESSDLPGTAGKDDKNVPT